MNQQFITILTSNQAKFIQEQLPAGYSLQLSDQHQSREFKRAPLHKLSIEEIRANCKYHFPLINLNKDQSPHPKRSNHKQIKSFPVKQKSKLISQILPPEGDMLIIPLPKECYTTKTLYPQSQIAQSLKESSQSYEQSFHPLSQSANSLLQNDAEILSVPPPLVLTKSKSKKSQQVQLMTQKQFSQCQKIIHQLRRNKCISPFLTPVDPIKQGLDNYFQIIKYPMDLTTIDRKLKRDEYNTQQQFLHDVNKMINNSLTYHKPNTEIYEMTLELKQFFEELCISILDRPIFTSTAQQPHNESLKIGLLKKRIAKLQGQIKKINREGGTSISKKTKRKEMVAMTIQEKKKLGQNIRKLPAQYLQGLWRLVKTGIRNIDNGTEEIEIDIDQLSIPKTRELERYVNTKIKFLNRIQQKERKLQKQKEINLEKQIQGQFEFAQQLQQQDAIQMLADQNLNYHEQIQGFMNQNSQQQQQKLTMDHFFEIGENNFSLKDKRKNNNVSMNLDT